ncbi:MAG: aminopeptidase P family protein [Planctomyces sp.]|nr:aminopeptidase P family protein [Planctomyces sp.]
MSDRPAERRSRLQSRLVQAGLDGCLVTSEPNVRYLTGFTGDSTWLLVGARRPPLLVSDRRYETQLAEETPGLEAMIRPPEQMLPQAAAQLLESSGLKSIGFEGHAVSVSLHQALAGGAPGVTLLPQGDLIEELRSIKDDDEIAEIRSAVDQAIRGFLALKAVLTPDRTEREFALELETLLRRFGARGFAFEPIIGVGDRAALPHYHAGGRRLGESPLVLIDWGAETNACYRSDLTRTLFTGPADDEMRRVYDVVREAQRQAIATVRPGASGVEVDAVARKVLDDAGYGPLSHGLGHGFGLQIHEKPRLGPNFSQTLEAGMVVTVEPGIYIPGRFGVRIEDDVLVTPEGCEVLSGRLASDWESAQVAW